jgi:hypothetical protein
VRPPAAQIAPLLTAKARRTPHRGAHPSLPPWMTALCWDSGQPASSAWGDMILAPPYSSTPAPRRSRNAAASTCPASAAHSSGVLPGPKMWPWSRAEIDAPRSSSAAERRSRPPPAARHSAGQPSISASASSGCSARSSSAPSSSPSAMQLNSRSSRAPTEAMPCIKPARSPASSLKSTPRRKSDMSKGPSMAPWRGGVDAPGRRDGRSAARALCWAVDHSEKTPCLCREERDRGKRCSASEDLRGLHSCSKLSTIAPFHLAVTVSALGSALGSAGSTPISTADQVCAGCAFTATCQRPKFCTVARVWENGTRAAKTCGRL